MSYRSLCTLEEYVEARQSATAGKPPWMLLPTPRQTARIGLRRNRVLKSGGTT